MAFSPLWAKKGAPTEADALFDAFLWDAEGDHQMEPDDGKSCNREAEAHVEQRCEPPRVGFNWVLLDSHTK